MTALPEGEDAMALSALRQATAATLRRLSDLLAAHELTASEWHQLAEVATRVLDAHADEEEPVARQTLYARAFRDGLAGSPGEVPEIAHPIGLGTTITFPPLDITWDDAVLGARVHFGPAFEGPPDRVHGGYVAMAFDVVVSAAAFRLTPLTVTRRLSVRYLRPTMIGTTVSFEATPSWIDERRIEVSCRAADEDGRTTATAKGECAVLDAPRFGGRSGQSNSPSA